VILTVLVEPLTKSLLAAGLAGKSMQERGCRAHREKTWSVTWGSVAMYSLLRRCRNGTFAGYPEYIRMGDGRGSCLSFEIWICGGGDGRHRFARLLGAAPWAGRGGALVEAVSGASPRRLGPVLKDESSGPAADSGG
jgi:hypothetical protein